MIYEYDVVIVGGGIAGLVTALTAAKTAASPKKIKVTEAILKTKKKILQQLHPKKEQETN
jgi:flavin-dependent dehydrogenase